MPVNDDRREGKDTPGPGQHFGVWKTKGEEAIHGADMKGTLSWMPLD